MGLKSYALFADSPDLSKLEAKVVKIATSHGHKLGEFVTVENGGKTFRTVGCLRCGTGVTLGVVRGEPLMVGDALQPCKPTHPG